MGMVAAARVDYCVLNAESGFTVPAAFKGTPLYSKRFAHLNLHIWLAPGRQALAQQLGHTLRAMEASGELARLTGPYRTP